MITRRNRFGAPWGRVVWLGSILGGGVLLGVAITIAVAVPPKPAVGRWLGVGLPLAILAVNLLMAVRGYVVDRRVLLVQRFGWCTRLELGDLVEVQIDPEAMRRSWKQIGNDGLLGIYGTFRNKRLGRYRAFATDPKRAVVLRFPTRTVVVTPDEPRRFVEVLEADLGRRLEAKT